jgi:hypothetical protein
MKTCSSLVDWPSVLLRVAHNPGPCDTPRADGQEGEEHRSTGRPALPRLPPADRNPRPGERHSPRAHPQGLRLHDPGAREAAAASTASAARGGPPARVKWSGRCDQVRITMGVKPNSEAGWDRGRAEEEGRPAANLPHTGSEGVGCCRRPSVHWLGNSQAGDLSSSTPRFHRQDRWATP